MLKCVDRRILEYVTAFLKEKLLILNLPYLHRQIQADCEWVKQ